MVTGGCSKRESSVTAVCDRAREQAPVVGAYAGGGVVGGCQADAGLLSRGAGGVELVLYSLIVVLLSLCCCFLGWVRGCHAGHMTPGGSLYVHTYMCTP